MSDILTLRPPAQVTSENLVAAGQRIQSIDLLRGVVMIIMALDHVRDYFHADAFLYDPTDLSQTSVLLFFTRWVTHYCAPVFVFLAGTSAFLTGSRKSKKELSAFLLTRGLWLVFLEITLFSFGWFFNIQFSIILLGVIWALGIGMIVLAGCVYFPFRIILALGVLLVAGHNALDNVHIEGNGALAVLWFILHQQAMFPAGETHLIFFGYPVIPWIGVMLLGYCFGSFYQATYDADKRKKILTYLGFAAIGLFVLIRLTNAYGDLNQWTTQSNPAFSFLSFINVSKYPPSLLYLLITLGPALLFLAVSENFNGAISRGVIVFGRVPFFYYVIHIYLIHILAVVAAVFTGYSASSMIFSTWISNSPELKGYGFNLGVVYIIWIALVVGLYLPCKWFNKVKIQNKSKWWVSYV